jgi:hypothetical protein
VLVGNYTVLDKDPGRSLGGGSIGLGINQSGWVKTSSRRGPFTNASWAPKSGVPDGYRPSYCWVLPLKPGALSARKNIVGAGALAASIAGGKNAAAILSGAGSFVGTGALIISMIASLTGSGTISNASAIAYLNLAASLVGTGDFSGAVSALAHAAATLSGSGTISSPTSTASGALAASIVVTGDVLNSANVASAVWGALALANNNIGSMGEKLNDAGSASNPWTEVIESGFTAAEILRLLASVAAGAATGLEGTNPQFTGIDGTTVRVDATYNAGVRTITSLDGA